jgi:hypothetical protein
MSEVILQQDQPDKHVWRLSFFRKYSAKSAYEASFQGSISFEAFDRIWKFWAPPKCSFFLWLVAHNHCWIADRLGRRNLPHPDCCLFCDQEESIDHLLVRCVFARHFWYCLLQRVGLAALAPQPAEPSFFDWWRRMSSSVSKITAKGLNSVIILGAWMLWWHRNACLFDGASPSLSTVLVMASEELWFWRAAGASELSLLTGADQGGFSWSVWSYSGNSRVCPSESVQCCLWPAVWLCVSICGCLSLSAVCGVFLFVFL